MNPLAPGSELPIGYCGAQNVLVLLKFSGPSGRYFLRHFLQLTSKSTLTMTNTVIYIKKPKRQ